MRGESAAPVGLPPCTGVRFDLASRLERDSIIAMKFFGPERGFDVGHLYLVGTDDGGIVDFEVDLSSGLLVEATVVSEPRSSDGEIVLDDVPVIEGIPMFSDHGFEDASVIRARQFKVPLTAMRRGDHLVVGIVGSAPDRVIRSGAAEFLFEGRRLVGFGGRPETVASVD